MICDCCQKPIEIGEWPFCPHGVPLGGVIGDEIPGGQMIETMDHQELTFYSKKAIRDAADARGLRIKDEWAGPQDKHLTNWAAAIDAKTLDDKRVLLARGSKPHESGGFDVQLATYQGSSRTIKKWSEVE